MWISTNGCHIKARLIHWFFSLTRGSQIAVSTIAAHFLLLFVLTVQHWITSPSHQKKRPIAVNTVRIAAPAPKVVAKQAAQQKPVSAPAKVVTPPKPVAKAIPKQAVKQETKAVSKPAAKAAPKSVSVVAKPVATKEQTKLLKEIEQNLSSIETPVVKSKKVELEVPVVELKEEVSHEEEASSTEQIAFFLQESLRLPEFGQVRMQLSIDRFGKLKTFEVLDAKSEKNAEFLKKQLPDLQFPCLNETVSLTIVFSNEL